MMMMMMSIYEDDDEIQFDDEHYIYDNAYSDDTDNEN